MILKNQQVKIITKTEFIKQYIEKEHLTRSQFAKRCGVSQSFIYKILSGKIRHYTIYLEKVLAVVDIPFEKFFEIEFLF